MVFCCSNGVLLGAIDPIRLGRGKMVELLIDYGARVNHIDKLGKDGTD